MRAHFKKWAVLTILIVSITAAPSMAITPEEQLSDPILEERARDISAQLRCLVCQNQSIDDSDADLARDLRLEVRSLLTKGLSDDDILAQIRATYGDYVLLNPPVSGATGLLWATPILLVLLGGLGLLAMRRKSKPSFEDTAPPPEKSDSNQTVEPSEETLSPKALLIGFVLIAVITGGLYAYLGRPDLEAQPLAAREAEISAANLRDTATDQALKDRLDEAQAEASQNPSSVELKLRLAMVAAEASAHEIELNALDDALRLTQGNPAIKAIKAEALSRKAGGLVTIPARDLIAEVLIVQPDEPRALYLNGLAAYQDEDYITALNRWMELQSIVMPASPLGMRLADNIADAANRAGIPVPENTSPLAMSEDMTEEEQNEMILGMVEGLEARLEDNPNDAQGWDRLIRARQTLGDRDGLIRALINAANAFPDQINRQVSALEVIVLEQQEANYLDDALGLLDRINTLSPRGPEFLFFAGHFAVLSGEAALAISLWQELEAKMADDNPLKAQLQDQIKSLQQ